MIHLGYNVLKSKTKERNTMITKAQAKKALKEGYVNLEFVKKDGSVRKMYGTLNMDLIPSKAHPKGTMNSVTKKALKESSVLRVYEKNVGWRSFDVNSVQKFGV